MLTPAPLVQRPFSVLFYVRDVLVKAGRSDRLDEFFARAERCGSPEQLVRVAREYVEIEEG